MFTRSGGSGVFIIDSISAPDPDRPRSIVFELLYDLEKAASSFSRIISLYVDPNETNPPDLVDEAIGVTWASVVHDGKPNSANRVYPAEWRGSRLGHNLIADMYYGMVPVHCPLSSTSMPVNREFIVEGRLIIKCDLNLPFRWAFRFPTHARWEKTPLPRKGQELDLVSKVVNRRADGVYVLEPFNVVFTASTAPSRTGLFTTRNSLLSFLLSWNGATI
ncbi:hypothetical protein L202_08002 [Cryptococcus amylolentus CBS 6039]|uniref:Uncharacterized protein n=1 Tax=Cryptococcus amylolentus CBS 6039 TaxID=1295533 RepID=A0A1E3HAX6_9TREE|nr:hypothetical protein L202_08002 [Cryptococcus amylolentus CBS 6039]ODN73498.1 hypothetical protein L202_08002 [Cryptococcus amylolentus CBS 6039]